MNESSLQWTVLVLTLDTAGGAVVNRVRFDCPSWTNGVGFLCMQTGIVHPAGLSTLMNAHTLLLFPGMYSKYLCFGPSPGRDESR